jgi:class 3 adenylate cyclase
MTLIRAFGRRPPFSLALVLVVAGFTALTGAAIGGLAWRENRATARALLETVMERSARLAAEQTATFLRTAESAASLGPQLVRVGQLDPTDARALERFTLATLRGFPAFSWVSYGAADDRFVGAWRDAGGTVHANHSFPSNGKILLEEDAIGDDGSRMPVRRSDDHRYRPTERPYFQLARDATGVVWTPPYEFYSDAGLGITCAVPLRDRDGRLRGVFTVDFSLRRLAEFLQSIDVSRRGHVYIATRAGDPLVAPRDADLAALPRPGAAHMERVLAAGGEARFEFDHGGERYLASAVPLHVGELRWLVAVVAPELDYTETIDASARWTAGLALLAFMLAVGGGVATARWIARPLRQLAGVARGIRRGNLEEPAVPTTRDEIGVLGRAMADMVGALRDREFVRSVLGRFSSPQLAERVLRDRDALRLGGELREVTLLFSDLRDFSGLSAALGAEAVIQLVNRYLGAVTPVILRYGGTIVDFVGDGIFVMFGAPIPRDDATVQAVRCAWAMQQAMEDVNGENGKLGLPALGMAIAVHVGPAVVGNIGSADRVKYGAVGPTVNEAARLQSAAAAGEVVLSAAALACARTVARVRDTRTVEAKGLPRPIDVSTLVALVAQD